MNHTLKSVNKLRTCCTQSFWRLHAAPVFWTDEKFFMVEAVHNTQNDRTWAKNVENISVEQRIAFRREKPASIMVWDGVTSCGRKAPLIFIEGGVKIYQHVYLATLKDEVLLLVKKRMGNSGVTLQQDGATSHTAKIVQSWCKENFMVFWSKEFWPPSSPDLNPMDFGVWSMLDHKACATSHKNIDALKYSLKKSWNEISPETLHATCSQLIDRLRCVIRAKGGYFK